MSRPGEGIMEAEDPRSKESDRRMQWIEGLKKYEKLCLAALLLLVLLLELGSSWKDAPTYDEPFHITSGYDYLTGVNRKSFMNYEHPPLLKDLSALPLLLVRPALPQAPDVEHQNLNDVYAYSQSFFYRSINNPDTLLYLGRLPLMLLTILVPLLVYLWAREMYGKTAAWIAVILAAFCPLLLAYGRLVSFDTGAALGILATLFCYYRYTKRPSWGGRWLTGIVLGLALATKITALSLFPILLLIALVCTLMEQKEGRGTLGIIWRNLLGLAFIFLIGTLVLLSIYGLHTSRMTGQEVENEIRLEMNTHPALVEKLVQVSRVSPPLSMFLLGVARNYVVNAEAGKLGAPIYIFGTISTSGFWYFFPMAFLLKTPLAMLALLVLALACFGWRKTSKEDIFILVPILVFGLSIFNIHMQLGVRNLLPLYPFLFILCGKGVSNFIRGGRGRQAAWRKGIVAVLLVFAVVSVLSYYPHFISYFNESIGARDNAYKYLIDSDLDWGQDLRRAVDYLRSRGVSEGYIQYFGGGVPEYYMPGLTSWFRTDVPPPGWFAISATCLAYLEASMSDSPIYQRLAAEKPEKVIGNSIFIYDLR